MEVKQLLQIYKTDPRIVQIVSEAQQIEQARVQINGLAGSLQAFFAAGAYVAAPQSHVFILENKEDAAYFQNDLQNILEKKDILFFPDSFKKPGVFENINKSNLLLRTETASRLIADTTTGSLVVSYPEAIFEKIINTQALHKNTIQIKVNDKIDINFVLDLLVTYGFENSDFVYEPGQFSVRGGIVDVYSFGNDLPYRIELFGNEVDSIRVFVPLTQLSTKKVEQITIVPNIQTQFNANEKTSFFQLVPKNTIIWIKEATSLFYILDKCFEKAKASHDLLAIQKSASEEHFFFQSPENNCLSSQQLLSDMQRFSIVEFGNAPYFTPSTTIWCKTIEQPVFNKNFDLLVNDLQKNENEGYTNWLFAGTVNQIKRLASIFEDLNVELKYNPLLNSINKGFIDKDAKIACYTDHQIFDRFYKYQIKQAYSKDQALTINLLKQLQPGDYVTHIDHGIGIFTGLEKITVNNHTQEVIRIVYKDNDVLYVNINSLHKVTKYTGKEGTPPKINKLGSDTWENLKRKAKTKIKDIAKDLITLYAKRKATRGFAFAPDTYLQTELEASFIYEDTPDQYKATQAVKNDMEALNPMDRLVCGDVGFGKTEIAVRAAAKAVADNKQVAILVPTTILALQHFQTFAERFKNFPCNIDFLNRFKSTKQKNEIIKKLAEGQLDIVIGTHGLIAKDVKFKDLGLLVIDEEQKFGVAAKEKLKNLKVNVDTLTLTATPIPRTLQFSLMNARDLSIINTPPPNRQPVQTELWSFDNNKIANAINFEAQRNGQVFFIHNRVKDIVEIANMLQKLCPEVSIEVAHGQLDNNQLESKLMRFINGDFDVLVSTNIVEAGLDIPNANTIIINNSHMFGLSDLHQLRGRVGRSNRKAFCYLISPPLHTLPDDTRRRLKAIEQFAELGSGFQIAMRDLDIRGAGNLLGAEQSGFITDIGFETFQKILNEAVKELKRSDFYDTFKDQMEAENNIVNDCQIETDLEMLIPDQYVNSIAERLSLYQQLDNIDDEQKLTQFKNHLYDRFGQAPIPVKEMFMAVRLRWNAKKIGFERIVLKQSKLRCYFPFNPQAEYYNSELFGKVMEYVQLNPKKTKLKQVQINLILVFEHVKSMKDARELLLDIEKHCYPATVKV